MDREEFWKTRYILGFNIHVAIQRRNELNPIGRFLSLNHDCNEVEKYLLDYVIQRGNPLIGALPVPGLKMVNVQKVELINIRTFAGWEAYLSNNFG